MPLLLDLATDCSSPQLGSAPTPTPQPLNQEMPRTSSGFFVKTSSDEHTRNTDVHEHLLLAVHNDHIKPASPKTPMYPDVDDPQVRLRGDAPSTFTAIFGIAKNGKTPLWISTSTNTVAVDPVDVKSIVVTLNIDGNLCD